MHNAPDDPADLSLDRGWEPREQGGNELLHQVYDSLRQIAGKLMRGERRDHTLQPTALVHEAYLRLVRIDRVTWKDKAHFCAMAAREMRRVLIDHARRRQGAKRGAAPLRVTLPDMSLPGNDAVEVLAIHEAMEELARRYPRSAQIAVSRLFGGLSKCEMATVLGVSESTIAQDWTFAKAWLRRRLGATEREL